MASCKNWIQQFLSDGGRAAGERSRPRMPTKNKGSPSTPFHVIPARSHPGRPLARMRLVGLAGPALAAALLCCNAHTHVSGASAHVSHALTGFPDLWPALGLPSGWIVPTGPGLRPCKHSSLRLRLRTRLPPRLRQHRCPPLPARLPSELPRGSSGSLDGAGAKPVVANRRHAGRPPRLCRTPLANPTPISFEDGRLPGEILGCGNLLTVGLGPNGSVLP